MTQFFRISKFNAFTKSDISQVVLCIRSCKLSNSLEVYLLHVPISFQLFFFFNLEVLKPFLSKNSLPSVILIREMIFTHQHLLNGISHISIVFFFAVLENLAKKLRLERVNQSQL